MVSESKSFKNLLEHFIFSIRPLILVVFVLATVFMAYSASKLHVAAGFEKLLPLEHPYIKTLLEYRNDFGGGNRISDFIDVVFDLNYPYTIKHEQNFKWHYPLNFISGNIWERRIPWENRSDSLFYVGRICEGKILPELLK